MSIWFVFLQFAVLFVIGMVFGLPILIPMVRQLAQKSFVARHAIALSFALLVFLIMLWGFTRFNAEMINMFSSSSYPTGYFGEDDTLDAQLERELWLHLIFPPEIVSTDTCFNENPAICSAMAELLAYRQRSSDDYWFALAMAITPALGCLWSAYYLTRDGRKGKNQPLP